MSRFNQSFRRFHSRGLIVISAAWVAMAVGAPDVPAQVVLQQQNSSITVNPGMPMAVNSWNVDGVEHLQELSNWWRVGNTGPERRDSVLFLQSAVPSDTDFDGFNDAMSVVYTQNTGQPFQLAIDYQVTGFALGSRRSRMGEQIFITNTGTAPLPFHFFEYMDLDLTNTPGDDIVTQQTPSAGQQSDGITIVTAGIINCDAFELNVFPNTLNSLSNGGPTNLTNSPGFGVPFGPNDVTWTLQWNFDGSNPQRPVILPGDTAVIIKLWEMNPVPEPAGVAMLVMASIAVAARRRCPKRTRGGRP